MPRAASPRDEGPDIAAVAAFAADHPDVYGGLRYGTGGLHVGLTSLHPHADTLRVRLADPASVTVELVAHTLVELADVRRQVDRLWLDPRGPLDSVGDGWQAISVGLRPDAVDVAADLHGRFGDRVRIRVGGRDYPPRHHQQQEAPEAPRTTVDLPGLQLHAELEAAQITAGSKIAGNVTLHNTGPTRISFSSGRPLRALVVDGAGRVAGTGSGAVAGVGLNVNLPPGGSQQIRFIGGTAGGTGARYTTPPGSYHVVVTVPVYQRSGGSDGRVISPPVQLIVVDPPGH